MWWSAAAKRGAAAELNRFAEQQTLAMVLWLTVQSVVMLKIRLEHGLPNESRFSTAVCSFVHVRGATMQICLLLCEQRGQ